MISDYCHGDKEHSQQFKDYVAQRGYKLETVKGYGDVLKKAGFRDVIASDKSGLMVEVLNKELDKFVSIKDKFVDEFSLEDFEYIDEGWRSKLVRCSAGDQAWGLFTATK